MTRLLLVTAALLSGLFTLAAALIQTAPLDEGGLRRLLLAPDCSAPCFLGLRPGESTAGEAVTRLAASPPLEAQVQYRLNDRPRYHMVNWSGFLFYPLQSAGRMDLTLTPSIDAATLETLFLRLGTPLTLGEVYLRLGPPESLDAGFWYHDLGTRVSLILNHRYAGGRLIVITRHLCPVQARSFWQTPILSIRYSAQPPDRLRPITLAAARTLSDCR
ncbi:MAG: hypothetical protein JNM70_14210 [Anaerolineae bacterium]|nr:hypothetical protein [Anaerolineae bacterium]